MSHKVSLYLYDLTQGLARQFSQNIMGRSFEGIWHTGVVVYGKEYFFGGGVGITHCTPGTATGFPPNKKLNMGETLKNENEFNCFLNQLKTEGTFTPNSYNLIHNNCNNFSDKAVFFLTGSPIPSYITNLPQEILSTPLGQAILPFINSIENPTFSGQRTQNNLPMFSQLFSSSSRRVNSNCPFQNAAGTDNIIENDNSRPDTLGQRSETMNKQKNGQKKKKFCYVTSFDKNINSYLETISKKGIFDNEKEKSLLSDFSVVYRSICGPNKGSNTNFPDIEFDSNIVPKFVNLLLSKILNSEVNLSDDQKTACFCLLRLAVDLHPESAEKLADLNNGLNTLNTLMEMCPRKFNETTKENVAISLLSLLCALFNAFRKISETKIPITCAKNFQENGEKLLRSLASNEELIECASELFNIGGSALKAVSANIFYNIAVHCGDGKSGESSLIQLLCVTIELVGEENDSFIVSRVLDTIEEILENKKGILKTAKVLGQELGECRVKDKVTTEKWNKVRRMLK